VSARGLNASRGPSLRRRTISERFVCADARLAENVGPSLPLVARWKQTLTVASYVDVCCHDLAIIEVRIKVLVDLIESAA
jgi:hypothetical protein